MPRGGHNRKHASQHLLSGTFRRDRHAKLPSVEVPSASLPEPAGLCSAAADCWRRLTGEIKTTAADAEALATYCRLWGVYCDLWPRFEAEPLDKAARVAVFAVIDRLDKIGRQFGWTPSSRAALPAPPTDDTDDPLTQFIHRTR